MSYRTVSEAGLSSERRLVFVPSTPRPGRRLVVLAHSYGGATGGGEQFSNNVNPQAAALAAQIASAGFTCIAPDLNYGSFGADPAPARLNAEWQAAITAYGCASDKVLLVPISMGFMVAHHFARQYPGKVAGVYGIEPGIDMDDIYANNRAGVQAALGAKWGVTYPTPLPAGTNPATNTSVLAGVPGVLAYSTADNVVLPATVLAYAAATNMLTTQVSSSLDHGDALIGQVNTTSLVRFLAARDS